MRSQNEAEIIAGIPHLRRHARGLVGDRDHADSLVWDTLERAHGKCWLWQRRGEIRVRMLGIMHNLFIHLRSQRRLLEEAAYEPPEQPERERRADRLELRELARRLARLPAQDREVLLLVGVERMSYQNVAHAIGVPIGIVMSCLCRARESLGAEFAGTAPTEKHLLETKRVDR